MRIIFINLFLLLCNHMLWGMGYYKITYNIVSENTKTGYTALFFYYEDSSRLNKMRIVFNDELDSTVIVEQNIIVEFSNDLSKKYRILRGYNTKIIRGYSKNILPYTPDIFVFKKNSKGTFTADYVKSEHPIDGDVYGTIESFEALPQLTDEDLKFFGLDLDQRYVDSMNISTKLSPTGLRLHLILATNTRDNKLGISCTKNQKEIEAFFTKSIKVTKYKLNVIKLDGKSFTVNNLNNTINRLKVNENDIVVFYYSGHGFRSEKQLDSFPILDFRIQSSFFESITNKNSIRLMTVYEKLKTKKPGCLLAFGECCNVLQESPGAKETINYDKSILFAPSNTLDTTLVKLLYNYKGNIIVGTARPHEFSYYYPTTGGIFWNTLSNVLFENLSYKKSTPFLWPSIIEKSARQTDETVSQINPSYSEKGVWYRIDYP